MENKKKSVLIDTLSAQLTSILEKESCIRFAYLHGSSLSCVTPNDIDIALLIDKATYNDVQKKGSVLLDIAIPIELKIENEIGYPVDIQILNNASLRFRYSVLRQSILLIDRFPFDREQFELLTRVEYFDFRPRTIEYLKGIAA